MVSLSEDEKNGEYFPRVLFALKIPSLTSRGNDLLYYLLTYFTQLIRDVFDLVISYCIFYIIMQCKLRSLQLIWRLTVM